MMKVTQEEDKHIKVKELQRNFSRKTFAPKKTSHHQMKMKSVTMKQGEFYSWKYKTPKKNMEKHMKKKLKRQKLTFEKN
jgi:hypothetical protein